MKADNSMGKMSFIMEHVYWGFFAILCYKNILFRCMKGYTFRESRIMFGILLVISIVLGICIGIKKRRNEKYVAKNLIFPFGIYTVFAYLPIRKKLIATILAISASVSLLYAILILFRRVKNKRKFLKIISLRCGRLLRSTSMVFSIGFVMIMGILGYKILFGSTLMQASAESQNQEGEYTIANHMDTLSKLKEEEWEKLTIQERLDVFQIVANIEKNYLGVPHELNVGAANLPEGHLGFYKEATHEIVISIDYLTKESSWYMLQTLCHEAYHSYQYCLAETYRSIGDEKKELRIFREAEKYAAEFDNYKDADDDYFEYTAQECESDARTYAEEAVYEYYTRIEDAFEP